jgi:hypothetical protein
MQYDCRQFNCIAMRLYCHTANLYQWANVVGCGIATHTLRNDEGDVPYKFLPLVFCL